MSMNAALSGLAAAQADISTISNNIANVSTIGFRGSRVEFADVFNASPYTTSRTTIGSGTQLVRVAQNFGQGNIVTTGNRLDLAIEGQGFFAVQSGASTANAPSDLHFTRAGAFEMNAKGNITNASGETLLGWPVSGDGKALNGTFGAAQPINIAPTMGTAARTSEVQMSLHFPVDTTGLTGQDAVPPTAPFDPADPTSFAFSSPMPVRDANGVAQAAKVYFVKTAEPDATSTTTTYEAHVVVDGIVQSANPAPVLSFNENGVLDPATAPFTFSSGATALSVDLSGSRLADGRFNVTSASDNGKGLSSLSSLSIDQTGTIWATYGAEDRVAMGKVMLANFSNPSGLRVLGNSSYAATADSGNAIVGEPSSQGFGLLRAGALESANVDLTEQLVDLIAAQRNYQASAKALETSKTMMDSIMNIRG
jgi:flagellar hook protein FlgE